MNSHNTSYKAIRVFRMAVFFIYKLTVSL